MKKILILILIFHSMVSVGQPTGTPSVYMMNGGLSDPSSLNPYEPSGTALPGWYSDIEKYWFYRYRLINDFMLIGDGAGKSIPAQHRDFACAEYAGGYVTAGHQLNWADATIDLGHYILVLATEYEMLSRNGFSTDSTLMELNYAQGALNRISNNAGTYEHLTNEHRGSSSSYPGNPGTGSLMPEYGHVTTPGKFFVRDDVPYLDFVYNNREHFNRPALKYNTVGSFNDSLQAVYLTTNSAFQGCYSGPNPVYNCYLPHFNFLWQRIIV